MKQNFATRKIVLQREEEIEFEQKTLEGYREKIKKLEDTIKHKEDYLMSYKKTLEVIL